MAAPTVATIVDSLAAGALLVAGVVGARSGGADLGPRLPTSTLALLT